MTSADQTKEKAHAGYTIALIAVAAFLANQLLHALIVYYHGGAPYLFCQYDCNWYAGIVENGYMAAPISQPVPGHEQGDVANWAFFPLFPVLSGAFNAVFGTGAHASNIIVSKLLLLPAIWAYLTFQKQYSPESPLCWALSLSRSIPPQFTPIRDIRRRCFCS
jgi:hypothetical protein